MLKPKWDLYHQALRVFISLTYVHTCYYFWRNGSEEVWDDPKGSSGDRSQNFNSCYSCVSDLLEKQEIELLNWNMATTLPFPCLMDLL